MFDVKAILSANARISTAVLGVFDRWSETYKEKNSNYGSSWLLTGETLSLWFPEGVTVDTPRKFIVLGLVVRMLDKLIRVSNLELTGEVDKVGEKSVDTFGDLGTYGYMAAAMVSDDYMRNVRPKGD